MMLETLKTSLVGTDGAVRLAGTGRSAAYLVAAAVLSPVFVAGCGDDGGVTATASSPTGASSPATASTSTGTATGSATATLSASQAFLATLSANQKTSVVADRTQANLSQWSNLPDPLFQRTGLRMDSLGPAQQQEAILDTPLREIVLGAGQDAKTLAAEGVKASTFTAEQRAKLFDLVTEWLTTLNSQNSAAKVTEATDELDQVTFAWSGETTIGNPIYYRVQSPTFIIKFAHQQGQDVQGGGITHIHSIYREIGNDYAGAPSS